MPSDLETGARAGGSATFRRFLADELLPAVRADYRASAETAIIGESAAGLFIVETLLREPVLFDAYVAVSPSVWWNAGGLVKDAPGLLADDARVGKRVFLTVGDEPESTALVATLAELLAPRVTLTYAPMPEETHGTIFHGAALRGLRAVLPPVAPAVP
ncbi:MAG: alpha/beta hydrolase-fold protein [Kofleriaceae bacterium]